MEQNVAGFEGVKSLDNTPNLFTIADLSQVWVVCDVFENDLGDVHLGDSAEIRLTAYPDRVFHGKVADISRVLDPNTRSAKVTNRAANPRAALRPEHVCGGQVPVPETARRSWWCPPPRSCVCRTRTGSFARKGPNQFRQIEVHVAGATSDGLQDVAATALKPGDEVVANALEFSTAMAEKK